MQEGINSLTEADLREACRARGLIQADCEHYSVWQLRYKLRWWMQLSLNREVPSSLLLLSAGFMLR